MMTGVLVCVKRVPDSSSEVVLTDDGQSVDGRFAGFTTSVHEECAVELAAQVAAADGGEATVLTLGGADAVEQLRAALAVGCSRGDPRRRGSADASVRPTSPARSRPWCATTRRRAARTT